MRTIDKLIALRNAVHSRGPKVIDQQMGCWANGPKVCAYSAYVLDNPQCGVTFVDDLDQPVDTGAAWISGVSLYKQAAEELGLTVEEGELIVQSQTYESLVKNIDKLILKHYPRITVDMVRDAYKRRGLKPRTEGGAPLAENGMSCCAIYALVEDDGETPVYDVLRRSHPNVPGLLDYVRDFWYGFDGTGTSGSIGYEDGKACRVLLKGVK